VIIYSKKTKISRRFPLTSANITAHSTCDRLYRKSMAVYDYIIEMFLALFLQYNHAYKKAAGYTIRPPRFKLTPPSRRVANKTRTKQVGNSPLISRSLHP
jgi:hypothetical protein